jgi:hypothetical protein
MNQRTLTVEVEMNLEIFDPMVDLHKRYMEFLNLQEFQRSAGAIFCGWDTEYDTPGGNRNVLLTHQFCVLSAHGCRNAILQIENDERPMFAELVQYALRVAGYDGFKNKKPLMLLLVCHFGLAEWSMLKDRSNPKNLHHLTAVRKVPVTVGKRSIPVEMPNGQMVRVRWFDTTLIAPVGMGSLDKLSSLLGDPDHGKISIPDSYKKNMRRFQVEHPIKFKDYAVRDAQATLEVFFELQNTLNRLVFSQDYQ